MIEQHCAVVTDGMTVRAYGPGTAEDVNNRRDDEASNRISGLLCTPGTVDRYSGRIGDPAAVIQADRQTSHHLTDVSFKRTVLADDSPVVGVVFHPVSGRVVLLGPWTAGAARDWWHHRSNRLPQFGVRMAVAELRTCAWTGTPDTA